MSILTKIQSVFNRKTSVTTLLNGYNDAFVEDTTNIISNDPSGLNVYINIGIQKLVTNITRAKFKIMDGENEITTGPVFNLFNDVNPAMFGTQLWKATVAWRVLKGESIWTFEPGFNGVGLPKEIYVHNPSYFEAVYNKDINRIVLWKYHEPGGAIIPLLPMEVIQFRVWNPYDEWRGINPWLAFEDILQQDYLSDKNNLYMLRNKSTPAGLLSTEESLSEDKAKEYIERWEKKHSGVSRAGRIAVLGSGLKYQQIGLTPEEMQYLDLKKWNRTTIFSKLGVPPAVSGYKDDTSPLSGTDTKEQLVQFWNQTLLPELGDLESILKSEFSMRWTQRLTFKFDTSGIQELAADDEKLSNRFIAEVNAGIITINEVREHRSLDPVPWGDTWWTSAKTDIQLADVWAGSEPPEPPMKRFDIFVDDPIPAITEVEKLAEYERVLAIVEPSEAALIKTIQEWLRKEMGLILAERETVESITERKYLNNEFWETGKRTLRVVIKAELSDLIGKAAAVKELNPAPISEQFIKYAEERLIALQGIVKHNIHPDTTKDAIKNIFAAIRAKVPEFVRLELMHIVNEVRMKTFLLNGFEKHLLFERDADTLPFLKDYVVPLYAPFGNGKSIPFSRDGRAISLPVKNG